jgi:glutamine synthetase
MSFASRFARPSYLNNARVELAAFDAAVTDWERFRGFERL